MASARKQPDESFLASEERFRLLVESVRDYAIFMLDPAGFVASWNAGAERIKGYAAHEIIGQHFSRFYPREALDRAWPQHELAVARKEGRFEDEGWRVRKDGTQFWANVVITALHDRAGVLRGFAKVTRDLTQRREVEALLESRRRTNEFLAMLGHELRNPLAPIRNAVAILRARGEPDATSARAYAVIERQAVHLGRIVDDLLDVSRISTGKVTVRLGPLDLAELVAQVVDGLRPMLEEKRQHLHLDLPAAPVRVQGDSTRLAQVVSNLLTNASKYTPADGNVWISVEGDGHLALVRVRDDGIGIPAHLLSQVFDLFTQGERGLDRAEGGLGIGLTVVHKLVELHGGTVTATSGGPGKGSEFLVRLPESTREHAGS